MKRALQILLPLVVVGLGAMVMIRLVKNRPQAQRKPPAAAGALVETTTVKRGDQPAVVRAHGVVRAAREVTLMPQVSGRVIDQHAELMPGGRLEAGATILRIERRDYDTQVSQAKAAVERAALELELERGRKSIADREWKLLGEGDKADARSRARALREPQLQNAEAQLEAAKAQLEQARANVRRTTLEAPFNALVVSESVDLGQLVGPQAMVARLVGTDAFWVEVAVPVADLHWLQVPGATAEVVHDTGGARVVKQGTVVRLMGDLDPVGRMARLLVEVPTPLDGETPLLLGAYVDVEIGGKPVEGVFEVPRVALREGDTLWVVGADGTLEIRPATITRRLRDRVLVSDGLRAGDQLITSRLPSPVPGMKVRPKTDPEAQARAPMEGAP